MDFRLTEEQQALKDSVQRFVSTQYPFEARGRIVAEDRGYSTEHWALFAELGWLMVPFREEDGGLGGSAVDLAVIMEELGRGLVVEPYLATAVLCGRLIGTAGSEAQRAALIPPIIEGQMQLAFACAEPQSRYRLTHVETRARGDGDHYLVDGHKCVVLNAPNADRLIVAARTEGDVDDEHGITLLIVDPAAAGVSIRPYPTIDGQRAAEVRFEGVQVPVTDRIGVEGQALEPIAEAIRWATLAVCAEAVGIIDVLVAKTVEYAKTRRQFGVAIGSFQALQHRMADMFIEREQARSILLMAAGRLDQGGAQAPRAVAAAKARIGRAARLIGHEAVQLHGAIGMSEELDVGHYFKRLTAIEILFGGTDHHTDAFADASAGAADC